MLDSEPSPVSIVGPTPSQEPANYTSDGKTVSRLDGSTGPNGGLVGYNSNGDKVEHLLVDGVEDDDLVLSENILRRSDRTIMEAYDAIWDRVWQERTLSHTGELPVYRRNGNGQPQHDCAGDFCTVCEGVAREGPDDNHAILVGRLSALAWVLGQDWDGSEDT
jgi:hypothetical protein